MGNKQGESKKYAATNNHKIVKLSAIFHILYLIEVKI